MRNYTCRWGIFAAEMLRNYRYSRFINAKTTYNDLNVAFDFLVSYEYIVPVAVPKKCLFTHKGDFAVLGTYRFYY